MSENEMKELLTGGQGPAGLAEGGQARLPGEATKMLLNSKT